MKFNIQTKFYLINSISILCILILAYSGYTSMSLIKSSSNQIYIAQSAGIYHAKCDASHDAIQAHTEGAFYNHATDHKDIAQRNITLLQGNITEYKENLQALMELDLPEEIEKALIEIKKFSDDLINKSTLVVNNLDSATNSTNYIEFEAAFDKLDSLIDNTSDDLAKFIDLLKNEAIEKNKIAITRYNIIIGLAIAFAFLVPIFATFSIINPQSRITKVMHQILLGNTNLDVPFIEREDEIGEMAKALDKFKVNNIASKDRENQAKQQEKKIIEEKRNELMNLSNDFEKNVKNISDIVVSAATEMDVTARELNQISNRTQTETKELATISIQTSNDMQTVSKAMNEFTSAINEINKQVTNSREYAGRATVQADSISNVVTDLSSNANAITGIIDIINNITSQIDLLALNATIEAARAGESGKGFAVVANEVKALATQTSKATEQINIQISAIQKSTNKAVEAIKEITASVKTINQNSTSIASAVEEQNVTASYVADNVSKVAIMSNTLNTGVEKVESASSNSSNASSKMLIATEDLLKQTNMLQSEVNKFLSSLINS